MRQVDKLVNVEAVHNVVREDRVVGLLGLAYDTRGARVIQEQVVDERGPPGTDTVGAAIADVADERVAATVPVLGVVVGAELVFL